MFEPKSWQGRAFMLSFTAPTTCSVPSDNWFALPRRAGLDGTAQSSAKASLAVLGEPESDLLDAFRAMAGFS